MDIESIAWDIAVNRTPRPPRASSPAERKADLGIYVEQLYTQHENIMRNFNDVLNGLSNYVLVPKECSDEMAEVIAGVARVCGGIADDIYDAIVKQAMVEVGGGGN